MTQSLPTLPADNARLIVHFVRSIQQVFATMAGLTVEIGKPSLKKDPAPSYDVSGIVGFSGDFGGSIVLSFHKETASNVMLGFTGARIGPDSPDFADAVGELANMIAGAAKKAFSGHTSISVPSVIIGPGHVLARFHDVPCVIIPCRCAAGDFALEVNLKARDRQSTPSEE